MALKQVKIKGNLYYDVCPNCKHWDAELCVCKRCLRDKRVPFGNLMSCHGYDDSHTRPDNWEMGMG